MGNSTASSATETDMADVLADMLMGGSRAGRRSRGRRPHQSNAVRPCVERIR